MLQKSSIFYRIPELNGLEIKINITRTPADNFVKSLTSKEAELLNCLKLKLETTKNKDIF